MSCGSNVLSHNLNLPICRISTSDLRTSTAYLPISQVIRIERRRGFQTSSSTATHQDYPYRLSRRSEEFHNPNLSKNHGGRTLLRSTGVASLTSEKFQRRSISLLPTNRIPAGPRRTPAVPSSPVVVRNPPLPRTTPSPTNSGVKTSPTLAESPTADNFPTTPDEDKQEIINLEVQYHEQVIGPIAKIWTSLDTSLLLDPERSADLVKEALSEGRREGLKAYHAKLAQDRAQRIQAATDAFSRKILEPLEERIQLAELEFKDCKNQWGELWRQIKTWRSQIYSEAAKLETRIAGLKTTRINNWQQKSRVLGAKIEQGMLALRDCLDNDSLDRIQVELKRRGKLSKSIDVGKWKLLKESRARQSDTNGGDQSDEDYLLVLLQLKIMRQNIRFHYNVIAAHLHDHRDLQFAALRLQHLPEIYRDRNRNIIMMSIARNMASILAVMQECAAVLLELARYKNSGMETAVFGPRDTIKFVNALCHTNSQIMNRIQALDNRTNSALPPSERLLRKRQVLEFKPLLNYAAEHANLLGDISALLDMQRTSSFPGDSLLHHDSIEALQKFSRHPDNRSNDLKAAIVRATIWRGAACMYFGIPATPYSVARLHGLFPVHPVTQYIDTIFNRESATMIQDFSDNLKSSWFTKDSVSCDSPAIPITYVTTESIAVAKLAELASSKAIGIDIVRRNYCGFQNVESKLRTEYILLANEAQVVLIHLALVPFSTIYQPLINMLRDQSIIKTAFNAGQLQDVLDTEFGVEICSLVDLDQYTSAKPSPAIEADLENAQSTENRILSIFDLVLEQPDPKFFSNTSTTSPVTYFLELAARPIAALSFFHHVRLRLESSIDKRAYAERQPEFRMPDTNAKLGPIIIDQNFTVPEGLAPSNFTDFALMFQYFKFRVCRFGFRAAMYTRSSGTEENHWHSLGRHHQFKSITKSRSYLCAYYLATALTTSLISIRDSLGIENPAAAILHIASRLGLFLSPSQSFQLRHVSDKFAKEQRLGKEDLFLRWHGDASSASFGLEEMSAVTSADQDSVFFSPTIVEDVDQYVDSAVTVDNGLMQDEIEQLVSTTSIGRPSSTPVSTTSIPQLNRTPVSTAYIRRLDNTRKPVRLAVPQVPVTGVGRSKKQVAMLGRTASGPRARPVDSLPIQTTRPHLYKNEKELRTGTSAVREDIVHARNSLPFSKTLHSTDEDESLTTGGFSPFSSPASESHNIRCRNSSNPTQQVGTTAAKKSEALVKTSRRRLSKISNIKTSAPEIPANLLRFSEKVKPPANSQVSKEKMSTSTFGQQHLDPAVRLQKIDFTTSMLPERPVDGRSRRITHLYKPSMSPEAQRSESENTQARETRKADKAAEKTTSLGGRRRVGKRPTKTEIKAKTPGQ